MQRTFLHHAVLLVVINLIIKPLYIFGIDLGVQNVLGPEEYGLFFALFNFGYLFQIINDIGLPAFTAKHIAQNPSDAQESIPQIVSYKLGLAAAYLLTVFTVAWVIGYRQDVLLLLLLISFNHILISYTFFLRANLTGLGRYTQNAVISILDKLVMILLAGFCLLHSELRSLFTIYHFVILQTVSLLVSIVGAFLFLKGLKMSFFPQISYRPFVRLLKRTWPFAVTVFLMTMYTRVDAVMLERLLPNGREEAGIYAAGYRLLDAGNMFLFLIASLLLPMFAESWTDRLKLKSLFASGFKAILWACFTIALCAWVYAQEWMDLLYVHSTDRWTTIFSVLILSILPGGMIYLYSTFITASGRLRSMNYLFIVGIMGNIALNFWLIPEYGAHGAAMATLGTESLVAVGLVLIARLSWTFLSIRYIAKVCFLLSVCLGIASVFANWSMTTWWIECIIMGLLILLVTVIGREFTRSSFSDLYPQK